MVYYFAWVPATETTFDPLVHKREDENVFEFELMHDEGDFPVVSVAIKNPKRRLLTGNVWAWLAVDDTPMFLGRLVAVPENLQDEIVNFSFVARPQDFDAKKRALAATLRIAPFWDEVWLRDDRLDDPDVVLEARPDLWHIDRVTHELTISNILGGEDGTYVFGQDDYFYDSLRVAYGSPPLRRVRIEAEIAWEQRASGSLSVTDRLVAAFKAAGSKRQGLISSYTGQGLEAAWPEPETNLRGGWSVGTTSLERADGVWIASEFKDVAVASLKPKSDETGAKTEAFFSTPYTARFYLWEFKPEFTLEYEASRQYFEHVSFDIEADVQSIVTEPGDAEVELITLSSRKVSEPVYEGGPIPIGDLRRNSYIRTDRGKTSVEYLIALGRAKLLARARAVQITIRLPFESGLTFSCRKSCQIDDPRIFGGTATGKIVSYSLVAKGNGEQYATVTIACTIGQGNVVAQLAGNPSYVEDAYVEAGYQFYEGSENMPIAGEVTYADYSNVVILDDGINLFDMEPDDVIIALDVINGETEQLAILNNAYADIPAAIEALNAKFTEVWLELKPLEAGPFQTTYNLTVSQLMVPRTVLL